MRLALVAPAVPKDGLSRATTKPRLISATLVRTQARKVRSLSRCSEARFPSGTSRCLRGLSPASFINNYLLGQRGSAGTVTTGNDVVLRCRSEPFKDGNRSSLTRRHRAKSFFKATHDGAAFS